MGMCIYIHTQNIYLVKFAIHRMHFEKHWLRITWHRYSRLQLFVLSRLAVHKNYRTRFTLYLLPHTAPLSIKKIIVRLFNAKIIFYFIVVLKQEYFDFRKPIYFLHLKNFQIAIIQIKTHCSWLDTFYRSMIVEFFHYAT